MGYVPLLCKDCKVEIFVDVNMVMLTDDIWRSISDKHEDAYCDKCIESRLSRPIKLMDLKPSSSGGLIPCNAWWIQENRPEYFDKI
jgi:hypothetical protein